MSEEPAKAPVSAERWASRLGLVLAMAGNAVGLGNFLRFPAQAARYGGGAYLIPYFVSFLVVGLPLVWIEWAMGRYAGQFGHHSTPGQFDVLGKRPFWKYLGVFGLWSNLIIAAYYLYIESWCITYAGYSLYGGFLNGDPAKFHGQLTGQTDPYSIVAVSQFGMVMFFICIVINISILMMGLAKGIELVCKIGMPLLIIFAIVLAIRGLMITPGPNDPHAVTSAWEGLNFVWNPNFNALSDPTVWLAAAGQIFFTLSIGMGSIQCYSAYLRKDDDVTLNAAAGAWTNEFCEVVLGGTILIPISVAYLGMAAVVSITQGGSGFELGFFVFPKLFSNWGPIFGPLAGFLWYGLLFFAAITSSLAMGQPIMAFLQDEFGYSRKSSALAFLAMLLPFALPVAMLHSNSFFDEFDYWAGTFSLVVMAVAEAILWAYVFGAERGWNEMMRGAELQIPRIFFWIIKYVTPTFLLVILLASTFKGTWTADKGWDFAPDSMIGKLIQEDLAPSPKTLEQDREREAQFLKDLKVARTADRLSMVAAFVGFSGLVWYAWQKRRRAGEASPTAT